MRFSDWVLLWSLAFAWYHVGIVWLVQVIVWPLFAYVGHAEFDAFHQAWWRGIRYVIFVPSGFSLAGIALLFYFTPAGVPRSLLWIALGQYILTYVLTAVWWGPEQAKLKTPDSPRFPMILKTHWIRTALVSGYALCLSAALVLRIRG